MFAIRLSLFLIGALFPFLMLFVADAMRILVPDLVRRLVIDPGPGLENASLNGPSADILLDINLNGFLLMSVPCLVATAVMVVLTLSYRHRRSVFFPAFAGFSFLAWAYLMNEFNMDAQGAIVYFIAPIYSLVYIFIGWLMGLFLDRVLLKT